MADKLEALEELRLYTLTDLESFFGVTHQTLLRWVKAGTLPAKKIGGKWRCTKADIAEYISRATEG